MRLSDELFVPVGFCTEVSGVIREGSVIIPEVFGIISEVQGIIPEVPGILDMETGTATSYL